MGKLLHQSDTLDAIQSLVTQRRVLQLIVQIWVHYILAGAHLLQIFI